MYTGIIRVALFGLFLSMGMLARAQQKVAIQQNGSTLYVDSLETAVNLAQPGDIIYVPGGVWVTGPALVIDKPVTLIGVGFHGDSTLATGSTIVQGNVHFLEEASNSVFMGIHFAGCVGGTLSQPEAAANILFDRCRLESFRGTCDQWPGSGSLFHHFTFRNCVLIGQVGLARSSDHSFYNCIIQSNVLDGDGLIRLENCVLSGGYFESTNLLILNCIFTMTNISLEYTYGSNTVLQMRHCVLAAANYGSTFSVNLTSDNLFGQLGSTVFAGFTGGAYSDNNVYQLTQGSPAIGAGVDGTDCGIYGGANPWKEGAVPFNPHISQQSIDGTTNPQGNLPVTIRANAQDR